MLIDFITSKVVLALVRIFGNLYPVCVYILNNYGYLILIPGRQFFSMQNVQSFLKTLRIEETSLLNFSLTAISFIDMVA